MATKKAAAVKVYRVEIKRDAGPVGGWVVQPTDAQGRVKLPGRIGGYGRRHDAKRGAQRRFGAKVRIVYV